MSDDQAVPDGELSERTPLGGQGERGGGETFRLEPAQRALLEQLPVVTYVADPPRTRLYYISERIERLLGYTAEEWLADPRLRTDRLHPKDRYRVLHEVAQARANDEALSSEYRMLTRQGRVVWVQEEAVLVRDAAGRPLYWQGCLLDMTDERFAEDDLRRRADQQAALAAVSQLAVVDANHGRLFGETAELVTKTLDIDYCALFESAGRTAVPRLLAAFPAEGDKPAPPLPGALAERALVTGEPQVVADRRYGSTPGHLLHDDAVAGAAVPVESPEPRIAVLTVESRAPRVFTRDEVRFLESVANVLASALARLATETQLGQALKMNALGRLAAGIAHDFNNLLTAILGFGELLAPVAEPDERAREHLRELQATSRRAAALVEQLLTFARERPGEPMVVDPTGIVAGMEGLLARLVGEDVELRLELAPDLPPVRADPHQIEQVIMNLAMNARDAMPDGGPVWIRTRAADVDAADAAVLDLPPGPCVVLEVEDRGVGMDAQTAAQVFEPFFTTKQPGKGTGLGLSTVFGIARRHGGGVEVDTQPGRGTRMAVYLPQAQEALPASAPPEHAAAAMPCGRGTVLVVEDQLAVRSVVRDVLTERGYDVLEAADGVEALAILGERGEEVDLLLSDVSMPGMNGPELVQRIAARRPDLPIVLMSGRDDPRVLAGLGVREGRVRMLRKPFTLNELLELVAAALTPPR